MPKLRRWVCILTILVFLSSLLPVSEAASGKNVRIGYFTEPNLMDGAEEGAYKSGYIYEYIQELTDYTGWRYEYEYGSFSELYQKLLSGEIDMLPYVTYTEKRTSEVLFPDQELGTETLCLAALKDVSVSPDFQEVNGKKVGTLQGSYHIGVFNSLMEENNVSFEWVEFTSPEDRWNALANGDVDFTIENSTVFPTVEMHIVRVLSEASRYCLAINMDRKDLLEECNTAMTALLRDNPAFVSSLESKYFKDSPWYKEIPDSGKAWLKNHDVLRIASFTNDGPYIFKQGGDIVGVAPGYVDIMLSNLNIDIPVEWHLYDTMQQMLDALNSGEVDAINPFYHNYYDAEQSGVLISSTVIGVGMGLLYLGDYTSDTISRIATPNTRLGAAFARDNFPDSEIIGCEDVYECIDKVLSGEADCVLLHASSLRRIAKEYSQNFTIHTLNTMCEICFATTAENAGLISIINKSVPFVTGIQINALENKYSINEAGAGLTLGQYLKANPAVGYGFAVLAAAVIAVIAAILIKRRTERQYAKQLAENNTQLEKAKQEAEAANSSKTSFLFNMSHDIRTPMNAIMGFTTRALKHADDKEILTDSLNKIQVSGDMLLTLINDVLDMSRVESGAVSINESPGDVYLSFYHTEPSLRGLAAGKNIDLSFEFKNIRDRYVYADFSHANRILLNVISNAIKYTNEGGWVRVTVEQLPGYQDGKGLYRYTVSDNGIGMSEDFLKNSLFKTFSRESNAMVTGIQGSGLGLAVSKKFTELLGGTIECESRQGVGTNFYITLPCRIQEEANPHQQTEPDGNKSELFAEDKCILLAEDNFLNSEIAVELLEEKGFAVETAENGVEAVNLIRQKGPAYYALVLMDIQMPFMDGYEAARTIRQLYPDVHIPIIALSANAFEEDKQKALEAGMDDHVAKPIDVQKLMDSMAKFIG